MSPAQRQAERRRRQNRAESDLDALRDAVGQIVRHTEHLYAIMYGWDVLAPEMRAQSAWDDLLKAVYDASGIALPELTLEGVAHMYPLALRRIHHRTRPFATRRP